MVEVNFRTIFRGIKFEYKIAIIYLIIGLLWILFSDTIFGSIIHDKQLLVKINISKGFFYVIVTTILLFFLVKGHIGKLKNADLIIKQRNERIEAQNEEYKKINLELKISKEKAEESDRLKTVFLQNISHEIRTPMNAIVGFSGFLTNQGLTNDEKKKFITIIQKSSNQLLSIVSDILTIASIETKQEKLFFQKINIKEIIEELSTIFKNQIEDRKIYLNIKHQLPDNQSLIFTDQTKLKQILSNLISNAIKFTNEGFVEIGYYLQNNFIEFYVKDSGIGIKKEEQANIFERFRQANSSIQKKYGGTGLGLSISKAFVELLQGNIWVESEPDVGSTFYFNIPYNPVNELDKTSTQNQTSRDENMEIMKKTVLIADDNDDNYILIKELLKKMDLDLIRTKDGKETVEVCETNSNIDLILMDIKMPVMEGNVAAKLIKEFMPNLPIIAQTAYAMEYERESYEELFDDYITKPINGNDLRLIVLKYLA